MGSASNPNTVRVARVERSAASNVKSRNRHTISTIATIGRRSQTVGMLNELQLPSLV